MSNSDITLLHDVRNVSVKDGIRKVHEEFVIQGDKGLKIKFYNKENDNINKIVITGKGDEYKMKTYKNKDPGNEETLTKTQLMDVLKKNKLLSFAKEQMKGGAITELSGGAKKYGSKKVSSKKASSKKASSKKASSKKSYSKK